MEKSKTIVGQVTNKHYKHISIIVESHYSNNSLYFSKLPFFYIPPISEEFIRTHLPSSDGKKSSWLHEFGTWILKVSADITAKPFLAYLVLKKGHCQKSLKVEY